MRALVAAGIGLAAAFAVVTLLVASAPSGGSTSPKPLLTTIPEHP